MHPHSLAQNCERISLVSLCLKNGPFVFSSNKSCFKKMAKQGMPTSCLATETLVIFSRNLGYDIFTITASAVESADISFVCSALNSNKWVNPKKTLLLGAAIPAINQGFATLGNDD